MIKERRVAEMVACQKQFPFRRMPRCKGPVPEDAVGAVFSPAQVGPEEEFGIGKFRLFRQRNIEETSQFSAVVDPGGCGKRDAASGIRSRQTVIMTFRRAEQTRLSKSGTAIVPGGSAIGSPLRHAAAHTIERDRRQRSAVALHDAEDAAHALRSRCAQAPDMLA